MTSATQFASLPTLVDTLHPAAILAGRAMTAQLFGVKPHAPEVLLVTTVVLSVLALVATIQPARRAALEPIQALQTE